MRKLTAPLLAQPHLERFDVTGPLQSETAATATSREQTKPPRWDTLRRAVQPYNGDGIVNWF